ncbi:hypothetical protein NQ318_022337 [Aromia moschata]|uniref:Uncharacterized protein n=1 Tax=Aromia moschata TaxID=1265417 RepID=A0AAV8Z4K2_9CUCU|nr:hypothetical protein NQ318_022337 [Aromia moschata]
MNASTSNSGFKKPKELARPVSSAPPLRALETSSDGRYSPTRSVLNVPSRNASFSGGNANNSTDNKRRPDNIAQGVSEMPVQVSDVLPSVPRLGALSENVPAKKNIRENNSDAENSNSTSGNLNFRVFGSSESERMFIFTGTVERIIKWNKIFQNHFCYFEVIASVISIQEGTIKSQKIMLLRDRKGPILQMIYYGTTHLNIEDFHVGQILRCMGKMSAPNVLNAISIRSASQEEVDILQRLCLVCDQAISHFLNA